MLFQQRVIGKIFYNIVVVFLRGSKLSKNKGVQPMLHQNRLIALIRILEIVEYSVISIQIFFNFIFQCSLV